jgi:hypothetical protein
VAELLAKDANFDEVMSRWNHGDARFNLGLADFAPTDGGLFTPDLKGFATQLGGICTHALADFAPHFGGTCTHALAESAPHFGGNGTVKTLKPLNPNPITPPTQPVPAAESEPASEPAKSISEPAQSGGRVGWSFSEIAQNNSINSKGRKDLRKFLRDEQELSHKFLAWILYAYSPLGKGLTDATGVSKAIKSLCCAEPEFAPQKFERLVKLGPQKLQELFDRDYAREDLGKSGEAKTYEANFKKLDPARKSDLYFALFGKDSPEPAAKPKVEKTKTVLQVRLEQIKAQKMPVSRSPVPEGSWRI